MSLTYKHTLAASYTGYITQAVVNNLIPLLFVTFSKQFDISLVQISFLIVMNFSVQIAVDIAAAAFVDRLGFKRGAVIAHICAAAGLIGLGIFPFVINPPIIGIIISVVLSAVGGGLCEVIISPVVESLPLENKAANMSILHSFYCWGQMAVVLLSTLYFTLLGTESWRFLPMLWAVLPALNAVLFSVVPIYPLCEPEEKMSILTLASSPAFLLFFLLMFCAGAAELAMSQWASYFAEQGLMVSKTVGDLLGPCAFAFTMGLSRVLFSKLEKRCDLKTMLAISSGMCIASYLLASLSPWSVPALLGCAMCGMSVGLMWPGVTSLAAAKYRRGGGSMFAMLAIGGDIGCSFGPWLVGIISNSAGRLQTGLLFAIIFPMVMLIGCLKLRKRI